MASQHIASMEWGDASVQVVLQDWWRQAKSRDSDFIHANACTDVHDYMIKKVRHIVTTVRRPGQSGWSFYSNGGPGQYIPCLVWADGTPQNQATPLGPTQPGEQWWPCICLNVNPDANGLIPFYCPALAWGNSRPWWVHVSRVRRLVGGPPQQEPLGAPPPPPPQQETSALVLRLSPPPAPPPGTPTTAASTASSTSTSTSMTTSSSSNSTAPEQAPHDSESESKSGSSDSTWYEVHLRKDRWYE